jgi:hypothetical protein
VIPVAFLVNGSPESAMGHRARAFHRALADRCAVTIAYREGNRASAARRFLRRLRDQRPALAYVFDLAAPGVAAATAFHATSGTPWVLDTGDAVAALARSMGTRSAGGILLSDLLERLALTDAAHVVVRGTAHRAWLATRGVSATVVQDGVWVQEVGVRDGEALRRRLGVEGRLTIGVLGSTVWNPRLRWCYGWELIETVRLLASHPVAGIVIGDGDGRPTLERRAAECGIADRIRFVGRVPYDALPEHLAAIDVALSTQTNDLVGAVRTTGKLPLYLAAGRYVLASAVGEAALVLPPEMLVPYDGVVDSRYPERLADRIRALVADPAPLARAAERIALAERYFDYSVLAPRVAAVIQQAAR